MTEREQAPQMPQEPDWTGDEPSREAKEEAKRRFKEEFGEVEQP